MKSKSYRRRKFNKKRKSTFKIFFLVIVGMTLGFAAINTTLQLIGTLNIARTTWNIHWENPTKTGGVNATSDVHLKSGDNTTVEYQVKLSNPGDYYEFTVDAKNDGTIDGMITGISNKVYENNVEVSLPGYLESTITYSDGATIENNHLLAASKKETYKVKVAYKTGLAADQLPDTEKTYNFRFTVTYMQAEENAKNRLITLPTGRTKDNLQTGDEICIKDQCFNFIKYDGNDVVMLAKYNLKVGNIYSGAGQKIGEYTSSDPGYNKQSSDVRGWVSGASTNNGMVAFSQTYYWSSLDLTYPADVYDATNYGGAPGEANYSVAYYVERYKDILTNYGVTIKDARLLKYEEAIADGVGCNTSNRCQTDGFITNTTFWLASAYGINSVWYVRSDGGFGSYGRTGGNIIGVRPVVVIAKADI